MRHLLVDTHVLLWWLGNHRALSATARAGIADPANIVFVSAISIWEARIKQAQADRLPPEPSVCVASVLLREAFLVLLREPAESPHARLLLEVVLVELARAQTLNLPVLDGGTIVELLRARDLALIEALVGGALEPPDA